jgi:hypothetical protein
MKVPGSGVGKIWNQQTRHLQEKWLGLTEMKAEPNQTNLSP